MIDITFLSLSQRYQRLCGLSVGLWYSQYSNLETFKHVPDIQYRGCSMNTENRAPSSSSTLEKADEVKGWLSGAKSWWYRICLALALSEINTSLGDALWYYLIPSNGGGLFSCRYAAVKLAT